MQRALTGARQRIIGTSRPDEDTRVPVSKSKRKRGGRRRRPPAVQTPPKRRRTKRWVPFVFFACVGVGVVLILLTYVFWGGRSLTLFSGLGLIGVAFAVATQWY
jgi:hypothetical protein